MDKRSFFAALLTIFVFLAVAAQSGTPVFRATDATGTVELNVSEQPTPPPGPPGPSGGGGAILPSNVTVIPKEAKLEVSVINDTSVTITGETLGPGSYFADMSGSANLPITNIGFLLREGADKFMIIIEVVPKPEGVPAIEDQYGLETPYQYVRITVIGIDPEAPFRTVSMNFKVEKEWIKANNVDEGTVALYRYQNGWKPLSVIRTAGDDRYSRFNAGDVRAFSAYFVISAKKLIVPPTLFAPAYVTAPMTYLQLAVMLFGIFTIFILLARRRRGKELVIEPD
jgi:PGF-pre-PGF domain-containing protein